MVSESWYGDQRRTAKEANMQRVIDHPKFEVIVKNDEYFFRWKDSVDEMKISLQQFQELQENLTKDIEEALKRWH